MPQHEKKTSAVTNQTTFPLKFVAHCWVENIPAIERVLLLWCDVKKYVESARNKQVNLPNCVSFQNLYGFCSDPLVLAKFNFALAIAMILKPFLTEPQTGKPWVLFLARDGDSQPV